MKNNKKNLLILFLLFIIVFLLFCTIKVTANIYMIKDKQGKPIRITNQFQMLKKEKDAGYTISILIEDEKEQESQLKKYGFKEKIDWEKVRATAQIIEQKLKSQTEDELDYPIYRVLATAYTPDEQCCTPFADGYTATGYRAGYGSIAIDPDYGMFEYGDVLYVEGYGLGVADDCGSAIKGKHIDVCFNLGELQKANDWGRQQVRVWKIES